MVSARAPPLDHTEHVYRPGNYSHLFGEYGLDQPIYPVEVADIPAIEDKLGVGINIYSFFDDEGKGRYPLYATEKVFERTVDLLYWDEHTPGLKTSGGSWPTSQGTTLYTGAAAAWDTSTPRMC